MDPGLPPYKDDDGPEAPHDWIQGWLHHYAYWPDHIGEEVDHFNTDIFKIRISMGK